MISLADDLRLFGSDPKRLGSDVLMCYFLESGSYVWYPKLPAGFCATDALWSFEDNLNCRGLQLFHTALRCFI